MKGDSAKTISLAMNKIFSAEKCWMSFCNAVEGEIQDSIRESFHLKEMSFSYMLECASIDFRFDNCLEIEIAGMIMEQDPHIVSGSNKEVSTSSHRVLVDEFGNAINHRRKAIQHENCPIAKLATKEVDKLISNAEKKCVDYGLWVSKQEKEKAKEKMSKLFNHDQCWESVCHEDSFIMMTSDTMEKCLDVNFPVTMTNPQKVKINPKEYIEDGRLACMIDYIMRLDRSGFNKDMNIELDFFVFSGSHSL